MSGNIGEQDPSSERILDPELKAILDDVKDVSWKPILVFSALVLLVWCIGFLPWFLQEKEWPWNLTWGLRNASEFGDSFGFINSLMSSFALIGVIAAIWLQKQELAEQRKELIITQWELRKSAAAQQQSQQELAKQSKINLQSTVLTALQGLEQSAGNPVLYEKAEGESTARFVDRLRQLVILDILKPVGETESLLSDLSSQLETWRDCTFVITACRDFEKQCKWLLDDGYNFQSGVRRAKLNNTDIDRTQYEMLIFDLERKHDKLRRAAVRAAADVGPLVEWLAVAKLKHQSGDGSDILNGVKALAELCDKIASETVFYRIGTFG